MPDSRFCDVVAYTPRPNGRTTVSLRCPHCDCVTEARAWSLAGSGKRCDCGAVLYGPAPREAGRAYVAIRDTRTGGQGA